MEAEPRKYTNGSQETFDESLSGTMAVFRESQGPIPYGDFIPLGASALWENVDDPLITFHNGDTVTLTGNFRLNVDRDYNDDGSVDSVEWEDAEVISSCGKRVWITWFEVAKNQSYNSLFSGWELVSV